MLTVSPLLEGLALGASLIIAIGAQNAFVLRQGLKREQVFLSAAFCSLADLALIIAGVFGLGTLVQREPWFLVVMTWGGAAFLFWYGVKALFRSFRGERLDPSAAPQTMRKGSLLFTLAALTFLNPHVYLDTVILLGGLGARHPPEQRILFAAGAAMASVLWFFGLAYGARLLTPLFARPLTWRILDALIAVVMFALALGLVLSSGLFGL